MNDLILMWLVSPGIGELRCGLSALVSEAALWPIGCTALWMHLLCYDFILFAWEQVTGLFPSSTYWEAFRRKRRWPSDLMLLKYRAKYWLPLVATRFDAENIWVLDSDQVCISGWTLFRLNYVPLKFICWSPNHQDLRMWTYLEKSPSRGE